MITKEKIKHKDLINGFIDFKNKYKKNKDKENNIIKKLSHYY